MIPIHRNTFAVGTVAFWRSAAPSYGVRSWRSAMDRFAIQHGKAIAMLANDGAVEHDSLDADQRTVTDEQVQKALEVLREQMAQLHPAPAGTTVAEIGRAHV